MGGLVPEAEFSKRYLAQLRRLTDDKRASKLLRSLSVGEGAWLQRTSISVGVKANCYALSSRLADAHEAWYRLGADLVGTGGYLAGWAGRPAIKHTGLGLSGMIVLAYLAHHGEVPFQQIRADLDAMVSRQTVLSRLDQLRDAGIVAKSRDPVALVDQFEVRLREYEDERGLTAFAEAQDRKMAKDRTEHQTKVSGVPRLSTRVAYLRTEPCVYCAKPAVRGEAEFEHFPARHWGGSDTYSLLFPTCEAHNNWLGNQIKRTAKLRRPAPTTLTYNAPVDDLAEFTLDLMLFEHLFTTDLILAGDLEAARSRVQALLPRLVAQRHGLLRAPDSNGELQTLTHINAHEYIDANLDEHRGMLNTLLRAQHPNSTFWGTSRSVSATQDDQ